MIFDNLGTTKILLMIDSSRVFMAFYSDLEVGFGPYRCFWLVFLDVNYGMKVRENIPLPRFSPTEGPAASRYQ